MRSPIIHLWAGGLRQTGGIEAYSEECLQALTTGNPERTVRVFSKNDLPSGVARRHGFGHRQGLLQTLLFAASGLAWAMRERPDFILTTHPHFMKALSLLPGVPCLSAAHGIEVWGHLQGRMGAALSGAAGLLPVSRFTAKVLEHEGGVDPARIRVVPNTYREELFAPGPRPIHLLQRYGLHLNQPVLLTVGRLSASERYKGHDQVLLALPQIIRALPDLRYVIAGRGDDEPRLRQLAAELGLSTQVIFAGYVPDAELADHYRLADLHVMPSTGEGFGIVFLESLACGRPCLVGDQDASPEAIDDGRLGLVVPPRDPAQIATAITAFFERRHDQPWLHDEQHLSAEVRRLFGRKAFRERLLGAVAECLKV
jgi:glycosyltransferase involved in cell wall biosynthesis